LQSLPKIIKNLHWMCIEAKHGTVVSIVGGSIAESSQDYKDQLTTIKKAQMVLNCV